MAEISYANKDHVVYEFAVRWWYALPEPWPPVDYDYNTKLKEAGLRKVEAGQRFKAEPDVDAEGLKKVYEIENYAGKFRDSKGINYDLRPKDTCPCISNFMKKERGELQDLLMAAYEA